MQTQNFTWVCIMMLIIVICLSMETKSLSLKPTKKKDNFLTQFYLDSISNGISAFGSTEVSLNGNVMIFQSITMLLINLTY